TQRYVPRRIRWPQHTGGLAVQPEQHGAERSVPGRVARRTEGFRSACGRELDAAGPGRGLRSLPRSAARTDLEIEPRREGAASVSAPHLRDEPPLRAVRDRRLHALVIQERRAARELA